MIAAAPRGPLCAGGGSQPISSLTGLCHMHARQIVTGLLVNRHLSLPREEADRLKAILTSCRRHGPESQNRVGLPTFRQHLDGRVGWVESVHPRLGARLRAFFERIAWEA